MASVPQRVGNYRIEKPIGKGATSQVVFARHVTLDDQQVAIKILLSQDPESVERFQREANIASRLRHPNIVQIYDHGYQQPFHYTIMEYVSGGALRSHLRSGKGLPLEVALHVFRSVGGALDYAHANGVIHRDVSPGNILIEQDTNRVLLTDFGIAREAGKAGVTNVGNVMGTPGYFSPEHAVSATAVTHLSDIYSLGVVLFELLTGKIPWDHFPGMGPDHNGGPFTPPRSLRESGAELPADVDRVVQTMLSKDPAKRYPSVQAAIDELEQILHRHTSPTLIVSPGHAGQTTKVGERARIATANLPPPLEREPHPVERALAIDLFKGPQQEARRRAEVLSNPDEIANLLDRWSIEGRFRRKLLGRQATIRRVESVNVYFYTMRVLYETRTPITEVVEPDYKGAQNSPLPLEKEISDRWAVKLPPPKDFALEPGATVKLPGSVRVVTCKNCNGLGRTICTTCNGRGRVPKTADPPAAGAAAGDGKGSATRPDKPAGRSSEIPMPPIKPTSGAGGPTSPSPTGPGPIGAAGAGGAGAPAKPAAPAAPSLVPCPTCSGSGGIHCKPCDGVGRLLQHRATTWSRRSDTFEANDDLPRVDERWLRQTCQLREIYNERQQEGFRPEWQHIPVLADLITKAQAGVGPDTRVAMSEVQISFIPITEIVFDLGDAPPATEPELPGKARRSKRQASDRIYSWHIYGFEQRLPGDWRFLNWDRVLLYIALVAIFLLIVMLTLAILRTRGML
jgi:hypothetical protein